MNNVPSINYDDIPNFISIGDPSPATGVSAPEPVEQAAKHDTTKPQYSLIPLDLLDQHLARKRDRLPVMDFKKIISHCHYLINKEKASEDIKAIEEMMTRVSDSVGLAPACMALQYGVVKYARDNWKQGFGGDYKRLLEATIRHTIAYVQGERYDGEVIPGFPKGNLHLGAIYFSLMVACNEAHIQFMGSPRWKHNC